MNVLKKGNPDKILYYKLQVKYFVCDICGCEWEATNEEYKTFTSNMDLTVIYSCNCPCCNHEVVKVKYAL